MTNQMLKLKIMVIKFSTFNAKNVRRLTYSLVDFFFFPHPCGLFPIPKKHSAAPGMVNAKYVVVGSPPTNQAGCRREMEQRTPGQVGKGGLRVWGVRQGPIRYLV